MEYEENTGAAEQVTPPHGKKERYYNKRQIQTLRDFLTAQKAFINITALERDANLKNHRLSDFVRGVYWTTAGGGKKKCMLYSLTDEEINLVHAYLINFIGEIEDYFKRLGNRNPMVSHKTICRRRGYERIDQITLPKTFKVDLVKTSWTSFKVMFKMKDKQEDRNEADISMFIDLMDYLNKGKLILKGYGSSYLDGDKDKGLCTITVAYQLPSEDTETEDADD